MLLQESQVSRDTSNTTIGFRKFLPMLNWDSGITANVDSPQKALLLDLVTEELVVVIIDNNMIKNASGSVNPELQQALLSHPVRGGMLW